MIRSTPVNHVVEQVTPEFEENWRVIEVKSMS